MANKKILLGLTTSGKSDWKAKIEEIEKFQIEEIALFPTMIEVEERKELYALLEKTKLKRIPHVHLRDDFENWEWDYLADRYSTEVFNVHAMEKVLEKLEQNVEYRSKVYLENIEFFGDLFDEVLKLSAGLCFDVSHYEDFGIIQNSQNYQNFEKLLEQYKIGCSHISAVSRTREPERYKHYITGDNYAVYEHHYLKDLSELDYVSKYLDYLPDIISIELENSFEEQIKIKKYLEKIIKIN